MCSVPSPDDGSFHGWRRPGPTPPGGVELDEGETLDYLAGHWRIFQYARGHRFSVDDALTAWFASTHAPRVERALDLGSGIGTVALYVAWRLPGAQLVTVEAQEQSQRLARKSFRFNGIQDRARVLLGDLRELELDERFDLVTGTPPYWPVGTRSEAQHSQAVPARLEVRGDIADYARAAARHLAPGGVFVCCFPSEQRERALRAIDDAGLVTVRTRTAIFKTGADYGLTLFLAQRKSELPRLELVDEEPFFLRTSTGRFGHTYAALRVSYGFPPGLID